MNRCSFCRRSAESVDTLAAETIANKPAGLKRATPVWESLDDEALLAHLPRIEAIRHSVDDDLRAWVGEARNRGISWDRVGASLGMRRQSAWERFS
ncbi:hypothetical protein SD37_33160 [Amycolatopsis orientalis]|uniref:Uncharacterized protein n=1 Tax=Amycolatopsis orientalis TaxID=31958 RepID=A0A193C6A6_AMYOR|nr:hypothetical protein [Amycolatopsis orientalis]ANN19984.1 hypothetical protein SD37_33160 [Amycolatopsis orientalis]